MVRQRCQQQGTDASSRLFNSCMPSTCQHYTCLSRVMQWVYQDKTVRGLDMKGT